MSLELSGIDFAYRGSTATLSEIDLTVAPGEFVALMGPSGCGKSTLFGIAAGFLRPAAGRIALDGRDITALPPERRGIGVVLQHYALFPSLSILDNVAYPLRARGVARHSRRATAQAALDQVGLGAMADRRPGALSGGQRQRVALARATVFAPPALLLDEPLSALDPHLRREMRNELWRAQRASGAACLMVTHDADEAFSVADRVVVMESGRIVQCGTPEAVYAHPSSLASARLTGMVNALEATVTSDGSISTQLGPLAVSDTTRWWVGDPVWALIRPERLRWSADGATDNSIQIDEVQARLHGGIVEHKVRCGPVTMIMHGEEKSNAAIMLPPAAITLVPRE